MALAVCCGPAFAQLGGGAQPSNAGAGMGGTTSGPNPAVNDGAADDPPATVARGDPAAGSNQIPPPRTPSANDDDDRR